MPKSSNQSQQSTEDQAASRLSDVALRKKKNADAQAAFRARRANYIATLEETGSLESVVIQLQDSCRETQHENQELRQENARLRHELREREQFWRNLYQTRKTTEQVADCDDPLPVSPSFLSHPSGMASGSVNQYSSGYRMSDDTSMCHSPYASYSQHPSSLSYSSMEDIPSEVLSNPAHRGSRYSFSYSPGISRETPWASSIAHNTSSAADSGAQTSHSPNFIGSPALTPSDISFGGRFAQPEDQKVPLSTLDAAPYAFPSSRSISPSTSTTPSSSSTSLTPFQFTLQGGQDRSDHGYRRHSLPHGAEVTLHGGTADVSLVGPASDSVRYRLANRRHPSCERTLLPALPPITGSENEQGSSDGDTAYPLSRTSIQRCISHSRSRSSSPAPPVLSGTLAVIKAQAFGALRRTRARTKRSSDGAAKVAMNVLEARGIGVPSSPTLTSPSLKRQRLDDETSLP